MRVLLLLLCAAPTVAQTKTELPDSPAAQHEHEFADRTNVVGIVGMVGLRVTDAAITCNYLRTYENFHEITSPLKSCPGVIFFLSGVTLVSYAGMRSAHGAGHHRLERAIPYVSIALSAVTIAWNIHASRRGVKCTRPFGCG